MQRIVPLLAAALCLAAASIAGAQIPRGTIAVRLELVSDALADSVVTPAGTIDQLVPVDMTPLGDGRQLVFTLGGLVRLLDADRSLSPGVYLNTLNSSTYPAGGEVGPTTIAAHPDFLSTGAAGFGKFYTITIEQAGAGAPHFGQGSSHQNVVKEWTVANPLDTGAQQFSGTSREILRVTQPGPFHGMFDVAFDQSGLMYLPVGDGGGQAYGQSARVNAQDPSNVYGNVLRIDPLRTTGPGITPGANGQYGIPTTNFGVADGPGGAMAEAFAYGFRSPYRISLDAATDDVWIGDVGAGSREEINRVAGGGNYGWGSREGTFGTQPPGGIDPLWELFHIDSFGQTESVTITGGFVYRGAEIPDLVGSHVFADFGERSINNRGELYYGDPSTSVASARDDMFSFIIDPDGEPLPERIYSIAEGEDGELYLLGGPDRFNLNNGTPGTILRMVQGSIAPNGLIGDVNQDGVVFGNGIGPISTDDVTAFVSGWLTVGHVGSFEQYTHGDLNLDGITDLLDAIVLNQALLDSQGSGFSFELLVGVPEPPAAALALVGMLAMTLFCRGRTSYVS